MSNISKKTNEPHYYGHRKRLKERFLRNPESIPDYELLEMFLYWIYPRRDVKPDAKKLLMENPSLMSLFHTPPTQCSESLFYGFQVCLEITKRLIMEDIKNKPLLNTIQSVMDYCHVSMAYLHEEQFRLFFLDKKYYLLATDVQEGGTIDQVNIYPREVIKRALEVNASFIVMVHNHPSGDPKPSSADMEMTTYLKNTLLPLGIRIVDHMIIGKHGKFSFRETGLIM